MQQREKEIVNRIAANPGRQFVVILDEAGTLKAVPVERIAGFYQSPVDGQRLSVDVNEVIEQSRRLR